MRNKKHAIAAEKNNTVFTINTMTLQPRRSMRNVSIGYRIFFVTISILCLLLSKWQFNKAQACSIHEEQIVICEKEDLVVIDPNYHWIHIEPDNHEEPYVLLQSAVDEDYFFIKKADFYGDQQYLYQRTLPRDVLSWMITPLTQIGANNCRSTSLLEMSRHADLQGEFFLLGSELKEVDYTRKMHRHYGYGVQWGVFAMVSFFFAMRTSAF